MGQITATRNLVATKVVRLAGQKRHPVITYCKVSKIRRTKFQKLNVLASACSCLCTIYWSQVLNGEWRYSWSSADRRCSNYIWVINNLIAYYSAFYIRYLTVTKDLLYNSHNASVTYPILHQFVTEMCTYVHISVTKWCIVGYLSHATWDLQDGSIPLWSWGIALFCEFKIFNIYFILVTDVLNVMAKSAKPLSEPMLEYC